MAASSLRVCAMRQWLPMRLLRPRPSVAVGAARLSSVAAARVPVASSTTSLLSVARPSARSILLGQARRASSQAALEESPAAAQEAGVQSRFRNIAIIAHVDHGQKWCLRAKMSVDDPNKALRDPVIYRVNLTPHHRTGSKYKVYPTYDFACPVVDSHEGVTHALRTNEYHDRNPQYYWFIEKLGMRRPHIWDYSRMNFAYTLLSKRKLQWFVDRKIVDDWSDPRFPTVRGIRRRGMTIEALKEYILLQGPSKNVLLLDWDKFWAVNKKVIDPVAPRYVALSRSGLYKVVLAGGPEPAESKELPLHKKNPAVGNKTTTFSKVVYLDGEDAKSLEAGEEVTLMDWGNIIVRSVRAEPSPASAEGPEIAGVVEADLFLEGDFKKTKKKLTWLPDAKVAAPIPAVLQDYDYLITKRKLEEDDNFEEFLTPVTEFKIPAWADKNVSALKRGDIIQFERRGYYILDGGDGTEASPLKFISIPDGSLKSTSSKNDDGKAAAAAAASKGSGKKAAASAAAEGKKADAKKADGAKKPAADAAESKKPAAAAAAASAPAPAAASSGIDISGISMYRIKPLVQPLGKNDVALPTCMYTIAPLDA